MDRSLLGCGPWGHKELDMTERLTLLLSLVVQWLRLCTLNAEGLDSISGQGTRSHTLQRKIQNSETETQRSLVAQTVKNPPAMQETWLRFLGQEDALEEEWQPTPVFLPGQFQGQRSLAGRLWSTGSQKELGTT